MGMRSGYAQWVFCACAVGMRSGYAQWVFCACAVGDFENGLVPSFLILLDLPQVVFLCAKKSDRRATKSGPSCSKPD